MAQTITMFLLSFALVALAMPFMRRAALRIDLVDKPGGRKKHEGAVPLVGGLVVFPVFMILSVAVVPGVWSHSGAYFAALALLLVTGAIDDRRGVSPWVKFAVQFAAAILIVIPGEVRIASLGDLFGLGPFGLNFMSIPFSIIATVLLINAVNLMDGLDGLAGGNGFIVLLWLAAACVVAGNSAALLPVLLLMGALGGFLIYNMRNPWRRKASVFLGDSGSLALGLSLAWFTMGMARGDDAIVHPITVAWLLALPIYDTCGQFARRVSQGRHPFDADHDHFHHHFIYAGFPAGRATALILVLVFCGGLFGVAGPWAGLPDAALTYPWIALLFVHIYMSMRPHRFRRIVARLRRREGKVHGEG